MIRRSRWRGAGLVLAVAVVAAGLGADRACSGRGVPEPAAGKPASSPATGLSTLQQEQIEQLEALGYLNTVAPAPSSRGVTVYDEQRAFDGVNLYTSMHGPEAVLTDMKGRPLHRWSCTYDEAFPTAPPPPRGSTGPGYYRGVHLYPDGDLLAIFEGLGMVRLDHDGAPRWAVRNGAHHDVDVGPDGTIYVLTRQARVIESVHPTDPILEDAVEVLTPDGQRAQRISLVEAVLASEFDGLLSGKPEAGDIFHANSVRFLEGRHASRFPAFSRGRLLVSLRNRNAMVVVDPARRAVVWAMRDVTTRQHDASLLDDGRLLVFDNRDRQVGSRAVEIAPRTREIGWTFPGPDGPTLFSERFGSAQRLPNGNTLVTFSELGTALEVTTAGRVVWRFDSPHRTGVDDGFVVPLLDVHRYTMEYVSWLPTAE